MATGTASANPAKLEAAAQAVPEEVKSDLQSSVESLIEQINTFNRGTQQPERIAVSSESHAGSMALVYSRGNQLDEHLRHVAAAFRTAGGSHPEDFIGPVAPGLMFMDDAALQAELDRWNTPQSLEFRPTDDGGYEVQGPDGHWYTVQEVPPLGAPPLGQNQEVVDFGNPDYGMVLSAGIIIGLTGGSTSPASRPAPPSAYEYIHLDENGYPVAGSDVTGHSVAPRDPLAGDAGTTGADGIGLVQGGLSEASNYVDDRYRNVYQTQTTFYVDPVTNERVAVVDAASIRYDNDTNEAIVTSGRLSTNDDGQPTIVPRPNDPDPDAASCPTDDGQPSVGPASELRIPVEDD